jgi:arylsulfatase A-like enzyme
VPLIVRWPGGKGNGSACNALVELVDLYPTLCDLADIPIPEHTEGQSLVPLLSDPSTSLKDAAFSQFRRRDGRTLLMGYAMRTNRYRYVEWLDRRTREVLARELYDQQSDPQENTNLAVRPESQGILASLNKQLWKSLPPPPALPELSATPPAMRVETQAE